MIHTSLSQKLNLLRYWAAAPALAGSSRTLDAKNPATLPATNTAD
jgi:hypothetical protein